MKRKKNDPPPKPEPRLDMLLRGYLDAYKDAYLDLDKARPPTLAEVAERAGRTPGPTQRALQQLAELGYLRVEHYDPTRVKYLPTPKAEAIW